MTTIAEVCRREPRIGELVGSITFMGGALTVPGNVTPGAEANIMQDPEAADAILRSGVETTMIGLDVTHQRCSRGATSSDGGGWVPRRVISWRA